jgi:integrase
MVDVLRHVMERSHASRTTAAMRDRALLLVTFFGALRRSEVVALRREDIRVVENGLVVRIGHSKTDQEGRGQVVGVRKQANARVCPVVAWREWCDAFPSSQTSSAFVALDRRCHGESLRAQAVERILRSMCRQAGFEGMFTPHSLRAGFATSAAAAGIADRAIAKQTRHKSTSMLHRYVREARLFVDDVGALA